jgi:hypothetical protein
VVMKNVFGIRATNCRTNPCRASAPLAIRVVRQAERLPYNLCAPAASSVARCRRWANRSPRKIGISKR